MQKPTLLLLLCSFLGIISQVSAQLSVSAKAVLQGSVIDAEQKQPIEFATVSLLAVKDSALITGTVTDEKGQFSVNDIPFGDYWVHVNFMGLEAQTLGPISFSAENQVQDLPTVALSTGSTNTGEVEITAEKNQLQLGLDRKIFDVEKSTLAQGGTATDVLRNVPTLDVDQNGAIKLRGNQGVTVLINGKPSALTGASRKAVLDQIPANMVKSVEIITNPSAKYDPDGISGIINIILKKNTLEGFSANASYTIGTLANKHNGTLGFSYRNKKINFFANYNVSSNRLWEKGSNYRENILTDSLSYMDQYSNGSHLDQGHFAKIGMDYFLNDRNTFSFAASLTPQTWDNEDSVNYRFLDENKQQSRHYRRDSDALYKGLGMEYNLNYTHTFKNPEQKWSADATYSKFAGNALNNYTENDFDQEGLLLTGNTYWQQNKNKEGNQILTAQTDYTHPFSKIGARLELGAKTIVRQVDNDLKASYFDAATGEMQNNAGVSNHFKYSEQVYAAYSTFGQKVKKFSYQVGLRLEQALTSSELVGAADAYHYNYFSFFPSAHFNYELPKQQQLQLAYSRRINRPDLAMLNPFIDYTDPLNVHQGNPYLRPEYIHSVELSHAKYWDKITLNSTLYYRYSSNVFRRMFLVDETTGVGRVKYLNFASSQSYGAEVVGTYRPFKWWNMNASFNVYTMQEDGSNIGSYSNFALWGHANFGSSFTLPKGFGAQMNIFYRSPLKLVIGSITEMWVMTFALSKSLFKGQANISLRVQDPFRLQRMNIYLKDYNYSNDGRYRWESQIAYLSFSYSFGKMDMKTRSRMRNTGGQQRGGGGLM